MGLRRNMLLSLVIHSIIIVALSILCGWNGSHCVRAGLLTVDLLEEMISEPSSPYSRTHNENYYHSRRSQQAVRRVETISPDERMTEISSREKEGIEKKDNIPALSGNDRNSIPADRKLTAPFDDNIETLAELFQGLPGPFKHKGAADQPAGLSPAAIGTGNSSAKNFQASKLNSPYALIQAAIENAKTYPLLARKKKIEGTVTAGFFINSEGYPERMKIKKSSGYEVLDSAAVRIVMKAAPFPRLTDEIIVPITFRLTEH